MKAAALSAAALILGGAGLAMQPRDPGQRPTTRQTDCTAGGCHARELEFRFLHAPAAVGACDVCHVYDDVARHTFKYKHTGAAMCDFCHIGKSVPGDPGLGRVREGVSMHVHDPVLKGECTACHNPHGSNIRRLVNAGSVGEMCLSCHPGAGDHAHKHTPVANGDCTSCHRAHTSMYGGLLVAQGQDLCLRCHEKTVDRTHVPVLPAAMRSGANSAAALMGAPPVTRPAGMIHDPVLEDCTTCHDHHGTAHAGLLKQDTVSLCASCHESVVTTASNARVQHSSVMKDKACMNCHSPHQSMQTTHLLRSRPIEMCLDCHAKETIRADGTKIAGLASLQASGQHLHGPLTEGQCRGCHQVHGGEHKSLLSAPYSAELYQPFSEGAYALCFTCHKSDLVKERTTTTSTRFRNGDQNLHYIHIAGQDESGRSCRLCHAPHAGPGHPRLVETVQYGDWKLPMEFRATDTGGSCGAGCHRGRTYDRERPVSYDVPPPNTTEPRGR